MPPSLAPDAFDALAACAILALAASSMSLTLTQTDIFAPLRTAMAKLHPMLGHLAHCFYCSSHWIVIAGIALYRPILISSGYVLVDLLVSVFVTVSLTTFVSGISLQVFLAAMTKALKEREIKTLLVSEA